MRQRQPQFSTELGCLAADSGHIGVSNGLQYLYTCILYTSTCMFYMSLIVRKPVFGISDLV